MSDRTDGGPAFPTWVPAMFKVNAPGPVDKSRHTLQQPGAEVVEGSQYQFGGMSLRDWFAGMALCGWLNGREAPFTVEDDSGCGREVMRGLAVLSYAAADAMLKARAPDEPPKVETRAGANWKP